MKKIGRLKNILLNLSISEENASIGYIIAEHFDDDKKEAEFIEKYIEYVIAEKKNVNEVITYFKELFDLEKIAFDDIPEKYYNLMLLNAKLKLTVKNKKYDKTGLDFVVFKLKDTKKNKSLLDIRKTDIKSEDVILVFENQSDYVYSNLNWLNVYMYLCLGISEHDYYNRTVNLSEYIYNLKEFYGL
ncbi:hypothetical protein HMPREF1143_1148 [Peptoanaerobacter stomatis]|uniref:Uncharacterized protein n=1 Tax=Peptoanaerobacter stomatis TaxID=796937 RepID=J6HHM1_9FIRM|nr:hypothetical protein [Peptoanaerobacter stomatis]EJU24475.1 hypothetical protein HMPREF1143_1148 [Peptoanaerobacter stomatis]